MPMSSSSRSDPIPVVPGTVRRPRQGARHRPDLSQRDQAPRARFGPKNVLLSDLAKQWVSDLRLQGRSQRTIDWYRQKVEAYLAHGDSRTLSEFTADSFRAYIACLQERELADNTIHGCFQVLKSLANWADREGYEVDPDVLRLRGPKLPELEMEAYSAGEVEAAIQRASPAWARLAVQILVGTGLRVSELCGLQLDDFEDDADATFLRVRRGKGGKFRRVPVSPRLRKAISGYVHRDRPEVRSTHLLLTTVGQQVRVETCTRMLHRLGARVGFRVHAHKFRHTFATTYLRNGGDMERLRRILGHSTYAMVMRYVHLQKDDLYMDFDRRTPF
jgi:site-specific recombinase XerD